MRRQPFFEDSRAFTIGCGVCLLLSLITTVAVLWAIGQVIGIAR